ncbi:MAG: tRNA-dihydrouridine synthase family protein [Pseudomonadota bacterium]
MLDWLTNILAMTFHHSAFLRTTIYMTIPTPSTEFPATTVAPNSIVGPNGPDELGGYNPHLSAPLTFSAQEPWLAPLAGYSDLSFRLLCREQGAAVCCTEMVSAKGLVYKSSGTNDLLTTTIHDAPLVVQLFGRDTDIMVQAMEQLMSQGFRYFDLNMGCSVPKVNKTGCGSAMLRDLPNAVDVAKTMVKTAGVGHVGFKFRLGWDATQEVYLDLAKSLEQIGAAWLTLHPRYARQGFSGTARWSALSEIVNAVSIPVIASGDLMTATDGIRCIQETGVATVMYARGAMNDPGIFAAHKAIMAGEPDPAYEPRRIHALISRHASLAKHYAHGRSGLLKMRTFVPRYVRHMSGARALRQHLASCFEWDMLDDVLALFFDRNVQGNWPPEENVGPEEGK